MTAPRRRKREKPDAWDRAVPVGSAIFVGDGFRAVRPDGSSVGEFPTRDDAIAALIQAATRGRAA